MFRVELPQKVTINSFEENYFDIRSGQRSWPNSIEKQFPIMIHEVIVVPLVAKKSDFRDLVHKLTSHNSYAHSNNLYIFQFLGHSAGQTMDSAYIVYHEKIKTSRIFVRECSLVPIYSMVVFGGKK